MPERKSFDATGAQWAFDSTSLKAAEKCPRYYQYSILEGWKSPYNSVHLWFGGIYAKALETYHKLRADGVEYEDAVAEVFYMALVDSWDHDRDESGHRIPGTGQPAAFDHASKNRETLLRTIVWYLDEFRDDHFRTFITSEGKAAVEHSFQIPVDEGITLCGHIDRLCIDPQDEVFVHDQKTTGSTIGPYFFKGFKPDIQFALYSFAGRVVYSAPVKGVIVDGAQIAVGFTRFGRAPILYTEAELNESYDEMMALIKTTRQMTQDNYFPRRTASCGNYGGCQFREVCSRPPQVRENFLKADFVKDPHWDPIVARD